MIRGTRVIDDTKKDRTVTPVQYDITSFGADYDVEGLVRRLNRNDILIPPFQRDFVWSIREASRFIESLLLGLPVPGIFLAREPASNRLLVIDGQQRLKSLQFFINGFFNPQPEAKTKRVFKLTKVQPQFEGRTFSTLNEDDRRMLDDSIIHATIVKQESPRDDDTSIYHIFERLNTSGRKLTPQQIRVAIYHGVFIDMIKELNDYPTWREIYGNYSATLKDQELVLRFLALYFDAEKYKRPMKEFLNLFAQRNREQDEVFLENCRDIFIDTIDVIFEVVGPEAFRPRRAINAAIFDSVMTGVARRLEIEEKINQLKFKLAYSDLLKNNDYLDAITQHTSDEDNVELRIELAELQFLDV
jgi:uncharacterized protein with ParB-like and HNH nuclease domain